MHQLNNYHHSQGSVQLQKIKSVTTNFHYTSKIFQLISVRPFQLQLQMQNARPSVYAKKFVQYLLIILLNLHILHTKYDKNVRDSTFDKSTQVKFVKRKNTVINRN